MHWRAQRLVVVDCVEPSRSATFPTSRDESATVAKAMGADGVIVIASSSSGGTRDADRSTRTAARPKCRQRRALRRALARRSQARPIASLFETRRRTGANRKCRARARVPRARDDAVAAHRRTLRRRTLRRGIIVDVGNPHVVVFGAGEVDVEALAAAASGTIRALPAAQRARGDRGRRSIESACGIGSGAPARTQACGTGAVAAAVAGDRPRERIVAGLRARSRADCWSLNGTVARPC